MTSATLSPHTTTTTTTIGQSSNDSGSGSNNLVGKILHQSREERVACTVQRRMGCRWGVRGRGGVE